LSQTNLTDFLNRMKQENEIHTRARAVILFPAKLTRIKKKETRWSNYFTR